MHSLPPMIDRRRLIGSAALAAGGLILPGCATTGTARPTAAARPGGCLPPVNVA
jgi:hypothetical protein